MKRYWVVGGEYSDTTFTAFAPGKAEVRVGPFASYDEAQKAWSGRAWATVDDAHSRYSILTEEVGPEAPTLCEGWTTTDLAAHLVVRERRPTGGPGILLGGPFARHTEQLMAKEAARDYRSLVDRVRNGPPIGPDRPPR